MQYTDNLDDYIYHSDTNSCYLDGRYFNKVLYKYPGLIKEPLNIYIYKDKNTDELRYDNYMKSTELDNNYPGLLRVILNTPESRHCSLLIIDYDNEKIYRFDPFGRKSPYFDLVNQIIENYLNMYLDFELLVIENPVYDEKNPKCDKDNGGFCVAYVIKYAYDFLNRKKFNSNEILKFASMIENTYGPLPNLGKDVEYGMFDNKQGRNTLVGGLGGALLGGAITGSVGGALLGGLGGGLIGSTL